ncbi:MAG TPA: hypothetical protein VJM34_09450 [Novosphingobium sp.]|nr:hypothetical protein [Novosphingobium sp.]
MAELTQADIDAAVAKAVGPLNDKLEAADAKNAGLLDDLKKAQREARAAKDITPEAHQAEVERADRAEARVKELESSAKTMTKERDSAVKALEAEQGAARTYALDAEINGAIAAGNVVPALVPALTALLKQSAKADLVEGKYAVTIGDKPAVDHIKGFLESDDGKAYRSAAANGGGGAPGGSAKSGGKSMTRTAFQRLDPAARSEFAKEGGQLVDDAA